MKKPAPRKPRIPGLTKEQVVGTLAFLNKYYGHDETFVKSWDANQRLAILRALEVAGFVEITRLLGLKRWVCTPTGILWMHMETTAGKESFSLDRDILAEPIYGWMTHEQVCSAAHKLVTHKLATALDDQGTPVSYFHLQRVVLTPIRSAVPGHEAYPRFYRAPDPMEQYA